jgi:hypothetical protein
MTSNISVSVLFLLKLKRRKEERVMDMESEML